MRHCDIHVKSIRRHGWVTTNLVCRQDSFTEWLIHFVLSTERVSFAKEPYKRDDILQKRLIILQTTCSWKYRVRFRVLSADKIRSDSFMNTSVESTECDSEWISESFLRIVCEFVWCCVLQYTATIWPSAVCCRILQPFGSILQLWEYVCFTSVGIADCDSEWISESYLRIVCEFVWCCVLQYTATIWPAVCLLHVSGNCRLRIRVNQRIIFANCLRICVVLRVAAHCNYLTRSMSAIRRQQGWLNPQIISANCRWLFADTNAYDIIRASRDLLANHIYELVVRDHIYERIYAHLWRCIRHYSRIMQFARESHPRTRSS